MGRIWFRKYLRIILAIIQRGFLTQYHEGLIIICLMNARGGREVFFKQTYLFLNVNWDLAWVLV